MPYRRVEVHVSLRLRAARLVLIEALTSPSWMDFQLDESERDVQEAGSAVRDAAMLEGLVDEATDVALFDCDAGFLRTTCRAIARGPSRKSEHEATISFLRHRSSPAHRRFAVKQETALP